MEKHPSLQAAEEKTLKLSKLLKKSKFSSSEEGSLERMRRKLLPFITQENKKKVFNQFNSHLRKM